MSYSLRLHGLRPVRLPYPPRVCSSSCLLSRWCCLTISSSVASFSCPQSFPASGSFPVSWVFTSGGQIIGASASVLPVTIQGLFPLGLTGLISLQVKGLSRVFSSTTVRKNQFFSTQPSWWPNSHWINAKESGDCIFIFHCGLPKARDSVDLNKCHYFSFS